MGYTASKLVSIARAEIGYLEKKTNANLDNKTGNAGYNNYTKYARDLYNAGYYQGNKNGYAWCEVFNDWCHWIASGMNAKLAQEIIYQTDLYGAGCEWSAMCYRNAGRWFTTPKVGDQIYFGSKGSESHTGIVSKVTDTKVYTIEGNTSGASGVVANGGGVCEKSYDLNYYKIAGYGRPNYDVEDGDNAIPELGSDGYQPTILEWQLAAIDDGFEFPLYGPDGEWGSECENVATKAIVKDRDYDYLYHNLTRIVQKVVGVNTDGFFGPDTASAVVEYQKKNNLHADGEVGLDTWKRILGVTHNDITDTTPTPEEKPIEPVQKQEEIKQTESIPVTEEKEIIVEQKDNDKEHSFLHIILEFLKLLRKFFEKKN